MWRGGGHYLRLEASQGQLTVAGPTAKASIPSTVYEDGVGVEGAEPLECGVRPDVALRSLGEGAAKSGRPRRFCLAGGWGFNSGRSWPAVRVVEAFARPHWRVRGPRSKAATAPLRDLSPHLPAGRQAPKAVAFFGTGSSLTRFATRANPASPGATQGCAGYPGAPGLPAPGSGFRVPVFPLPRVPRSAFRVPLFPLPRLPNPAFFTPDFVDTRAMASYTTGCATY